jgi:hypothetical protein
MAGKEDLAPNEAKSIIDGVEISEYYVILQWAVGEALNPKWAERNRNLQQALREKLGKFSLQNPETYFSEQEREEILGSFLEDPNRWGIRDIKRMGCKWIRGLLQVDEVSNLYITRWPLVDRIAPSGKLQEFVEALAREQPLAEGESNVLDNINRIYRELDTIPLTGYPVLLSKTGEAPFCAIDGISRLSGILRRRSENRWLPDMVPVIVGISDRIFDWEDVPSTMQVSA